MSDSTVSWMLILNFRNIVASIKVNSLQARLQKIVSIALSHAISICTDFIPRHCLLPLLKVAMYFSWSAQLPCSHLFGLNSFASGPQIDMLRFSRYAEVWMMVYFDH